MIEILCKYLSRETSETLHTHCKEILKVGKWSFGYPVFIPIANSIVLTEMQKTIAQFTSGVTNESMFIVENIHAIRKDKQLTVHAKTPWLMNGAMV